MTFFFALLPTDLQIEVFRTWLGYPGDGLAALSALDIACTSIALRPAFLLLSSSAFRGCDIRQAIRINRPFWLKMRWLVSRGVEVKAILEMHSRPPLADGDQPVVMPSVEELSFKPTHSADELCTLISMFPGLKSLSVGFYRTAVSEPFWSMIQANTLAHLESLKIDRFAGEKSLSAEPLISALQSVGGQLVEFHFEDGRGFRQLGPVGRSAQNIGRKLSQAAHSYS